MNKAVFIGILGMASLAVSPLFADRTGTAEQDKRIHASAMAFHEIMNAGDHSIPVSLVERAQCIVIVPNLKRVGLVVGGKYGKGIMTCRKGSGWSSPAVMRIEGGSVGLQI